MLAFTVKVFYYFIQAFTVKEIRRRDERRKENQPGANTHPGAAEKMVEAQGSRQYAIA